MERQLDFMLGSSTLTKGNNMSAPVFQPITANCLDLDTSSSLATLVDNVINHFCLPLPLSSPAILEMFLERDRKPYQKLLPWSGEFVGKYLTHCVQLYRVTGNSDLSARIQQTFSVLESYQSEDGYIGPWPSGYEFNPKPPNGINQPWDSWGHYHILYAAILWYEYTMDPSILAFAKKIGDLLASVFGGDPHKLYNVGAYEQNSAIIHAIACLYSITGEQSYLQLCNTILQEFQLAPCGDYVRNALAGKQYYEGSQPRWEGLISVLGIAQMAWITGNKDMYTAYQQIWWSLCQYERHNHGGIMSSEQASGSPYNTGSVETCCTVTWCAMGVEMLKMTGLSVVADELELSLWNTGMLLESPSGRWCIYNSGMSGQKESTTIELQFQATASGSELSCCSVNAPRMYGMLAEWALMTENTSPTTAPNMIVNFYGPCTMTLPKIAKLVQTTEYPYDDRVSIAVTPDTTTEFGIKLRIPAWSQNSTVTVNGKEQTGVTAGQYLLLKRTWSTGDTIELEFDFRLRGWLLGQDEDKGSEKEELDFQILYADPPKPSWDSSVDAKWTNNVKTFTGDASELMIINASDAPINNAPTSMMGWFATQSLMGPTGQGIPFSFGAGASATPNMARALDIDDSEINYFNGGGANDVTNAIDNKNAWGAAVRSGKWHHVAVVDDGSHLLIYLDGKVVGSRTFKDASRTTKGGYMVGGWADRNRYFQGTLGGVRFYHQALVADDINAAMEASKPTVDPPGIPNYVSLYVGPILLGFDPRFNSYDTPPTLNAKNLKCSPTTTKSWIQPNLLYQFSTSVATADGHGEEVATLADCGSLGVTGRPYTTWIEISNLPPQNAPFSKANPTRTFFF
eukprot:m.157630 g.157630  ORF g.157630 m.157630 type:complete len:854 (-) comp15121_c3_seq2:179-2740(-)